MNINTKIFVLLVTIIFAISCGNSENDLKIDSSTNDSLHISLDAPPQEPSELNTKEDTEQEEIAQKIVATYGEQWDFCTCIEKNDSIDKAIAENNLSDADLDFILARMDKIQEKCKLMTSGSQGTPEERKAHSKKVQDCLNK
ncbi:MAG: hypothetical protein JJT77_04105 [Crocinitomicaceae bacterium]|nr:hypothetical protein [Crocinitomicaceae bacterium]